MKRYYPGGNKPTKSQFHNKDGTLTGYSFMCGHIEQYQDGDNRLAIVREPNDYHVKGFVNDKHVWEVFETIKEARKFCRAA
jgi:hypothetical protein